MSNQAASTGQNSANPYCDIIQDRAPVDECAYYQEVWRRLEPGQAALDVPPQWRRNQRQRVSFALTRDSSATGKGENADPGALLDSTPERTATLRVGRRMAVRLSGDGFEIAPDRLVEQDLGPGGAARWDWDVTPLQGGRRRLTLNAYVVITTPEGQRSENLIRTLSQEVDVQVGLADKTKDAMQEGKAWLGLTNELLLALAALIGGGALAVWLAVRRFRSKRDAAQPADAGGDRKPAQGGAKPAEGPGDTPPPAG